MTTRVYKDPSRGLSIAQLILSIAGISISIICMVILGVLLVFKPGNIPLGAGEIKQLNSLLWTAGLTIIITILSLVYSIRNLNGKSTKPILRKHFLISSLVLLAIPLLVLLGNQAAKGQIFSRFSSLFNILLIIIPLWWIMELGRLQLNPGSPQKQWGVAVFSIYLTLPIILLVELVVILFGVGVGVLWLMGQPEAAPFLLQLDQLRFNPQEFQNLMTGLEPLLYRPEVIAAGLIGVALIIPLIEELLKTLALWFINKDNLTPAKGFTAGLICGATFALLESVFSVNAVPADIWLYTISGRVGTGLLHILTAGLNGWALALAWRDSKYLKLGLTYISTVFTHGTWNLFAILVGLGQVGDELADSQLPLPGEDIIWVLPVLTLLLLGILFFKNRRIRRENSQPPPPLETPPVIG